MITVVDEHRNIIKIKNQLEKKRSFITLVKS